MKREEEIFANLSEDAQITRDEEREVIDIDGEKSQGVLEPSL